jgi:hypothetical protein
LHCFSSLEIASVNKLYYSKNYTTFGKRKVGVFSKKSNIWSEKKRKSDKFAIVKEKYLMGGSL